MPADSHNHLHLFRDPADALRAMLSNGITQCVVNATSEADWPEVASLAADFPASVLPAFGIHPRLAHTTAQDWEQRLALLLEQHPAASIGECGLDRTVDTPSLATQSAVFETQLRLARHLGRPATIHCTKAWGALLESFHRAPPPPRFLMHSFQGSAEIAARLLQLGAFFSLPARLPDAARPRVAATFRSLPADRILLETDAPGVLPPASPADRPARVPDNDPSRLSAIAATWAHALGLSPEYLLASTCQNHLRCFTPA